MAERKNNKAGLQKKVSSVPDGAPIPKNSGDRQSSGTPAPQGGSDIPVKPAPAIPLKSKPSAKAKEKPLVEVAEPSFAQRIKDKLFTPKEGVSSARQKVMVVLVPVLAIVMIFVLIQVLGKSPSRAKADAGSDTTIVAIADSGDEIDWKIPELLLVEMRGSRTLPGQDDGKSSDPNGTRGPGQNGTTGKVKTAVLHVKDIVYSRDKPSAVIGNQIVYVGTTINGITIVKINRKSVEFKRGGETWVQNIRD
ncbi:MAG: hypothetical protein CEE38_10565 [Planctomycetes bacterium B3_Pla]|nr:MAG: hypothetical protein CEE38_10565 [Planctomycetes bacterium B3_Pla]